VVVIDDEGERTGVLTSDEQGDLIELDELDELEPCAACGGGPVEHLGTLGRREHGRCRGCGMTQSVSIDSHLEAAYDDAQSFGGGDTD
jgi:hypothetical protein